MCVFPCFSNVCALFVHSEVAFGYKGLQIQLYYSAGNLNTLFKVKYTSRVTDTFDCVEVQLLIPLAVLTWTVFIFIQSNENIHLHMHHILNKACTPCAFPTYLGLNSKHVLVLVYANFNIWCFATYSTLLLQILLF